jgi:hypothetical protein
VRESLGDKQNAAEQVGGGRRVWEAGMGGGYGKLSLEAESALVPLSLARVTRDGEAML